MSTTTEPQTRELLAISIGPACHELRSPLAVVYGFAKMIESRGDSLDSDATRHVQQITQAAQRLDELLDDLALLGRIAAGRAAPDTEPVHIAPLVRELETDATCGARVRLTNIEDAVVRVDPAWTISTLSGIIDACCIADSQRVELATHVDDAGVHVSFTPDATFVLTDSDPDKATLALNLARMRVMAMGGSLESHGDRLVVTLQRAH